MSYMAPRADERESKGSWQSCGQIHAVLDGLDGPAEEEVEEAGNGGYVCVGLCTCGPDRCVQVVIEGRESC